MKVRQAISEDAAGISRVLTAAIAGMPGERRTDPGHVAAFYVGHPDRLSCAVAIDDQGEVLGFQSLKLAAEGNTYGLPVGWGIVGTYVAPGSGRRGIGAALFAVTRAAAAEAGLAHIDATIGAGNTAAQNYYGALGFKPYRRTDRALCRRYDL